MKAKWNLVLVLAAMALIASVDAEAGRLGGGRNMGTQRPGVTQKQATPPAATPQSPAANTAAAPGAPAQVPAPAPSGARRWLGPLAGLAAGLGLAALFSHFGLGEGMANFALLLLVVLASVFLIRLLFRARSPAAPTRLAYSGPAPAAAGLHTPHGYETQPMPSYSPPAQPLAAASGGEGEAVPSYPKDFEPGPFLQHAKLNFTRLQSAFDSADLLTLAELCTPEMLREIQAELDARGKANNQTDVVKLEAGIVEVVKEGDLAFASVRFQGLIREHPEQPATPFDEVWNLRRNLSAGEGWLLAGIQQLS